MDIRTLRYVVTLAEELHFGRAAKRHFISAQPFGQHVQRLEREVGARTVRAEQPTGQADACRGKVRRAGSRRAAAARPAARRCR